MLIANDLIINRHTAAKAARPIATASYFIAQAVPIIAGSEGMASFLDVIVPLTGRTGVDAPSDHIIASLVSGILYLVIPTVPILAHRFGTKILMQAVVLMLFASGGILSIFAAPGMETFDFLHPKRVLCLYMEDTSTNTLSLHVAGLDPAPFAGLVENLATTMKLDEQPVLSEIRDDIADWDIVSRERTGNYCISCRCTCTDARESADISRQSIPTFLQDTPSSSSRHLCFSVQGHFQNRSP